MKISINEKLVKRNKTITQFSLYGAIALIVIGLVMTFSNSNNQNNITFLSYLVLLPAYILMQINALMMNKWGRKPREDEIVSSSLKGLDTRYFLYHYTTPPSHLLVGPSGIWIINAFHQQGTISYDEKKKKYIQKGGGNILSKIFALDALSDIEREPKKQLSSLERYFLKIEIKDYPQPTVANVFYHPAAKVEAKNAPELTIHIEKLKDIIRQKGKTNPIKDDQLLKITKKLPEVE
jgi:hypothetical protein